MSAQNNDEDIVNYDHTDFLRIGGLIDGGNATATEMRLYQVYCGQQSEMELEHPYTRQGLDRLQNKQARRVPLTEMEKYLRLFYIREMRRLARESKSTAEHPQAVSPDKEKVADGISIMLELTTQTTTEQKLARLSEVEKELQPLLEIRPKPEKGSAEHKRIKDLREEKSKLVKFIRRTDGWEGLAK